MDLLMNGLLLTATLFAGGYCWVLARRVRDLKSLDKGLGGAIVTLTRQIELARATLEDARAATSDKRQDLTQLIGRAESAATQLRFLLAATREPEPARPIARDPDPAGPIAREPDLARSPAVAAAEALAGPRPVAAPRPALTDPAPLPLVAVETADPDVPKPRALPPLESPLRPKRIDPPEASEDALIQALSALAAGGAR